VKNVLVVTYSQSGQLDDIVKNVIHEITLDKDVQLDFETLKPEPEFPFPWPDMSFWDAMPESVRKIPSKLNPLQFDPTKKYDLIILGYPIWFLSPPIPLTTFLKSDAAKKVMAGTPVVTVIGARNMWVSAQEDIKKMILENKGQLVGNIALHDRHQNLLSVVTIIYWLMTGKKDRYLGVFPKPGVSDEDILQATRFGKPIYKALGSNHFDQLQDDLRQLGSVELSPDITSIETKAKRIFYFWSGFISKKGGPGAKERIARLKMFKWYLLFVIFAVSPIASLVFYLTYPLFYRKIRKNMAYFKGVDLR
jgi:hypothetical protein